MKNLYIKICCILLLVLCSCSEEKFAGETYGSIEGKVVSAVDFKPLANVKVFSSPNSSIVFTDEEGKFSIPNVKVGDYSYEAQKDGYVSKFEAATINEGQATTVVFELKLSTSNNKAPSTPVLVSPTDNAVNQTLELALSWTATDPEKDAITYTITIRKENSNDVVTYKDIAETSFTIKELTYSTKYIWQVAAYDGINEPVLSAIGSFTTGSFVNSRFLFVRKINDNNVVFSGNEQGAEVQITNSGTNSWRPRKSNEAGKVAFIRSSGAQNHIYTMNADGTNIFKVTSAVPIAGFNSDFLNFSWNASGSQIIYPYFDKLYRINKDGSGLTMIYETPNGKFISECDWSKDATKIALKTNDATGYNVELYVINTSGVVVNQIASGDPGAAGGLNFTVDGKNIIYTKDMSGFQGANYRQLDTRVFQYNLSSKVVAEIVSGKPSGTLDLDARYSPNEAELIFTNTSNDGLSVKNIIRYTPSSDSSGALRTILFANASMPDWE
jgi:Tol biopolymer transport system component